MNAKPMKTTEAVVDSEDDLRPEYDLQALRVRKIGPARTRGPQKAPTKIPTTIRLDPGVLEGLRATGKGWQTRANADEALRQAVDALETALSFYIDSRQPLPTPSAPNGRPTVHPSGLESAKLGLYQAMLERGIRKAELARRLGWHEPQVDRLFDLTHRSRFD